MSYDPQAPPCIPGDMGLLSMVQGNLAAIAQAAGTICSQLQNANGQIVWSGAAHDAFQAVLKDVPYDLQKIQTSFGQAATALQNYLGSVPDLQSKYQWKRGQYESAYVQQQRLKDQLSTLPGPAPVPSSQTGQSQAQSLQDQIDNNQPQLDSLYNSLLDLYGQAEQAARSLKQALDDASSAGIQDSWGNTWDRYSGDVTGFVSNIVTGIVHDVEELVAAIGNLAQTIARMTADLLSGNLAAFAKDAQQALVDINDICRSLSNILMTLTPLLQLIPGIGEIVDVLDVIALAATALTVVTDVGLIASGGTAVDPLTGLPVDLRDQGAQNLAWDATSLVFSLLPGGGSPIDRSVDHQASDALGAWQEATPKQDLLTAYGDSAARGDSLAIQEGELRAIAAHDVAPAASFGDLLHYRQAVKDAGLRASGIGDLNPTVTLVNRFGLKMTFAGYTRLARTAGVSEYTIETGHSGTTEDPDLIDHAAEALYQRMEG